MAIYFNPNNPNNSTNNVPYPYNNVAMPYPYNTATYQPQVQPGSPSNMIIAIQGLEAAKAYPLGPNTNGYFFDTEKDYMYIKVIGPDGMQKGPVEIVRCTKITEEEYKGTPIQEASFKDVSEIESIIQKYLDDHQYRPYIPKAQRKEMVQNGQTVS